MRGSFIQNRLRFLDPDGSSTLFFRRLFLWLISREKFKVVHMDSIVEQTVISLVFEVRLSRHDPDASP